MLHHLPLRVVLRTGRKANAPSARQLCIERHAASPTRTVAGHNDIRSLLHVAHESVGSRVATAIGQHHYRTQPKNVGRRCDILGLQRREIVPSLAGLVTHVAHMRPIFEEMGRENVTVVQIAASVAANIQYDALAFNEIVENLVDATMADCRRERFVDHIAYTVLHRLPLFVNTFPLQNPVFEPPCNLIICSKISLTHFNVEILWIVFFPRPVAPDIGCGIEVHVSVFELREHRGTMVEEVVRIHRIQPRGEIATPHLLPIHTERLLLVGQEAVVFVDQLPKGLDITDIGVLKRLFADTT